MRCYVVDGITVEPAVHPEQSLSAVADYRERRCFEERLHLGTSFDRQLTPGAFVVSLLQPQPSCLQCLSSELEVSDTEAAEIRRIAYGLPSNHAFASD